MIIFGGVRERKRLLGYVADYCPICHEVRACKLQRTESYPHLYFIRLGPVTVQAHAAFCCECGSLLHGDVSHYTGVEQNHKIPPDHLIASTNPTLEERLIEHLDAENRAATGEASESERLGAIAEPFLAIENEVRRHHLSTALDLPAVMFLVSGTAGIVLFCLPWFLSKPSPLVQGVSPFAGCVGLVLYAGLMVYYVCRSRRYVRRRFGSYLVAALTDPQPSGDELDEVLTTLRIEGSMASRKIRTRWILERLTALPGRDG